MNFLILFLLYSTISINRISSNKHCIEQKCVSNISQWCCPYNTTCGSQNTCNDIKPASRQSYCQGAVLCFSGKYYWCCDDDQTCGSFQECNDNSVSTTEIIIIVAAFGPAILIIICGVYIRYRCLKKTNNNQTIHVSSGNQDQQLPIYLLTNSSMTQPNSFEQVYHISTPSATGFYREEPPPTYNAAMLSSTTQNQNKI